MGVEHPYLAILAVIAFTVAVTGVVYFFIHTYTEMLKTPVLSTYAEACYSGSNAYLTLTLKHERGLPVVLERVEVYSERGVVTLTPSLSPPGIQVVFDGFNGRLGPGQVGVVRVVLPLEYFKLDREYSGIVFFDAGNTVFTFQLVECTVPGITTILRAKLVDLNNIARNGTVTAIGKLRVVNIERSPESQKNILYYDAFDTDPFTTGRVINITCNASWSWDPVEKAILFDGKERSTTYGGECFLEFQNSTSPLNGTIYASTIIKFIDGEGWAEIALIQNESALYTLGIFMDQEAEGKTSRGYEIWRFLEKEKEEWKQLAQRSDPSLSYNVTYHIVASYTYGEGLLAIYVNSTDPKVTAVDKSIIPLRVGLTGTYPSEAHKRPAAAKPLKVYFYNLVITVNAPPWFTNITGVPVGWSVVLKNSTGSVVASGVSTNGTVTLSMWNNLIVPNGTIEVYDENGNLVVTRTFDYVVGGEVYELRVYGEFNALTIGIGSSSRILVYNISNIENPVLVITIDTSTLFNGSADIAVASGNLYLLNMSGVFRYDFTLGVWMSVTSMCKATGIGARIEVIKDTLVAIPGLSNSNLCLYNLTKGEVETILLTTANITEYTSTAVYGELLYISLVNSTTGLPVIVVYRVSNSTANLVGYYSITGYRLTGLAHDGQSRLLFIHEYGGVYELDTSTGALRLLPILLPFTPRGFGDRLEYYSGYLVFVRGDETTELYLIQLST
jgi:FlaG/FlaF family flagellin (archaellin)